VTSPDRKTLEAGAPSNADAELAIAATKDAASRALHAGMKAPLFTLPDASGELVRLEDLLLSGPVVLHFIRGAWCSFSEQSLSEFADTHREVAALGVGAIAIAPALSGGPASLGLPIRELQDADMRVAQQFGLAFTLPAGLRARYERLGYVPPPVRSPGEWLVPIPATYVLDRQGTVLLALVDADYRHPFDRESLLTALRSMPSRRNDRRALVARR
jgi:peroxiredoxin